MTMTTMKGFVATEPFDDKEVRSGVRTIGTTVKLETIAALVTLAKMKVVVACEELGVKPGDFIYVEARHGVTPWAKNVLQIDEKRFILVPTQYVVIKETE